MKLTVGQLIGIIVILVLIGVGVFFGTKQLKSSSNGKVRQAVFLINGQVYFGYTSNENAETVTLKNIYYLQVQQPLQQSSSQSNQQPQISLVKLGSELHGPTDEMRINRQQILFIEDMKSDSKVNQAIADYIKNGPAPTPSPTPSTKP